MDDKFNNSNNIVSSSDDEFVLGKGFDINTEDYNSSKTKKKHKKGSTIKNIIWIFSIIIISFGLAFTIIYAGADFMGIGFGRGENCVVEIEPGTPASTVAEQLSDCGAVKIPLLFRLYTKFTGYDSQFKYGVYTFNNEAGYETLKPRNCS